MFIQTEETPNPAVLKFLPGREVTKGTEGYEISKDKAENISPLAARLYEIEAVEGIFLGSDFVAVTKNEGAEWVQLKPPILGAIMEHFMAGRPVLLEENRGDIADIAGDNVEMPQKAEDKEIIEQIKELLDSHVRPAVAQDGGDIKFAGYDEGVVYLELKGACSGCPSSSMTLKQGVENLLCHYMPEIIEVREA